MKRKSCLNCRHGDIVRYGDRRRFPQCVLCGLVVVKTDPREAARNCSDVCQNWEAKDE
jgi:hypothetical protein